MAKTNPLLARAQSRLTSWLIAKGCIVVPFGSNRGSYVASLPDLVRTVRSFYRQDWERLFAACGNKDETKAALVAWAKERIDMRSADEKRRQRHQSAPLPAEALDTFLQTYEWRRLRMEALRKYGPVCQCCGASPKTGAVMNVDHIKPRKLFPDLALDLSNLQVLCGECNHGKGNWDMTDWRAEEKV